MARGREQDEALRMWGWQGWLRSAQDGIFSILDWAHGPSSPSCMRLTSGPGKLQLHQLALLLCFPFFFLPSSASITITLNLKSHISLHFSAKPLLCLHTTYKPRQSATMFRAAIARNARLFTTSARVQKSTAEAVKDTAKKVDRTVSDELVKGIEKGGTSS